MVLTVVVRVGTVSVAVLTGLVHSLSDGLVQSVVGDVRVEFVMVLVVPMLMRAARDEGFVASVGVDGVVVCVGWVNPFKMFLYVGELALLEERLSLVPLVLPLGVLLVDMVVMMLG